MDLTLDYELWRAGGGSELFPHGNMIGCGNTRLLNKSGFMCCLGQFSLQCGFTKDEIIDVDEPCELEKEMPLFNEGMNDKFGGFSNTALARECIRINDDRLTTYQQKIFSLHSLLKEHGIKLKVINTPEPINLPE